MLPCLGPTAIEFLSQSEIVASAKSVILTNIGLGEGGVSQEARRDEAPSSSGYTLHSRDKQKSRAKCYMMNYNENKTLLGQQGHGRGAS